MSGSVEFKINGNLVGHIYYHNEEYVNESDCLYSYEYHSWPNGSRIQGEVIHTRSHGLEVLIKALISEIVRRQLRIKTGKDK